MQFDTIFKFKSKSGDSKHSDYQFIFKALFLAMHVFSCNLMQGHCHAAGCECAHYWKFVLSAS